MIADAELTVAEDSTDADLAVAPVELADSPCSRDALAAHGFTPRVHPGGWLSGDEHERVEVRFECVQRVEEGRADSDVEGVSGARHARFPSSQSSSSVPCHLWARMGARCPRWMGQSTTRPTRLLIFQRRCAIYRALDPLPGFDGEVAYVPIAAR